MRSSWSVTIILDGQPPAPLAKAPSASEDALSSHSFTKPPTVARVGLDFGNSLDFAAIFQNSTITSTLGKACWSSLISTGKRS